MVALDNFIIDFPGTKFKEDALFLKFAYQLGINSVPAKWKNVECCKTAYSGLIKC
jgi:outer membrane protein assembly factor BamD